MLERARLLVVESGRKLEVEAAREGSEIWLSGHTPAAERSTVVATALCRRNHACQRETRSDADRAASLQPNLRNSLGRLVSRPVHKASWCNGSTRDLDLFVWFDPSEAAT